MFRLFDSIAAKLVGLAAFNALAFIIIAILAGGGFSRVGDLSNKKVADEMTRIVSSASLSRDITVRSIELERYSQSCGAESFDPAEGEQLQSSLLQLQSSIPDKGLSTAYQSFLHTSGVVIERCNLLHEKLNHLLQSDAMTASQIVRLEQSLGEILIEETLQGRSTAHLDQQMVLADVLRESQLVIGKQIAEQLSYSASSYSDGRAAVQVVDEMLLQNQTIIPVSPDIAKITQKLEKSIKEYRHSLIDYQNAHRTLVGAINGLRDVRILLLDTMQIQEANAFTRARTVQDDISQIIRNSSLQVLGIGLMIGLITVYVIVFINRRHINKPLSRMLRIIDNIRKGSRPETGENKSSDEWGVIEGALLDMSDKLDRSRTELMSSRERLEMALEGANDGLWDWNLETDEVYYSPRWKSMLGYGEHELRGSLDTWKELIDPQQLQMVLNHGESYLSGRISSFNVEFRMRHKSGHWVDVLARAQVAKGPDGKESVPRRLVGTHTDITARKLAERNLRQSEKDQRSLIEALPDVVMRFNAEGRLLFVSENISTATYLSAQQMIGATFRELGLDSGLCTQCESLIEQTFSSAQFAESEITLQGPEGDKVFNLKLTPDLDNDGQVRTVLGVARDITLIKEHQQQLTQIAHYDVLTGLPNRFLLSTRLKYAIEQVELRNTRLAVIYIDLDGFKKVNDTHGHHVGDELLKKVANRMQSSLREGDMLARLGGDEFVAILMDLPDNRDCEPWLNRLLTSVAKGVQWQDQELQVTASLGVTFYPQQQDVDADQLLRQADQAMYQAKLTGKNRFYLFDTQRAEAIQGMHSSIDRIRQGLHDREFLLFYQPKLNMFSGEIVGAEVLIRWDHPERGLLTPDKFLPVLENDPLGIELGERVISMALQQLVDWHHQGLKIPLSINIGAQQLQQDGFVKQLSETIEAYPGIRPANLEIEILETSALADIERTSEVIRQCRSLGVSVAIDDFGTGYSSLTYLKHLEVDTLKIDKSFVHDMLYEPGDLAILEGVITLAKAFHCRVIAEGVETIEQGQLLLDIGCHEAQGYVIAKPMRASELPYWFEQWQSPEVWLNQPELD